MSEGIQLRRNEKKLLNDINVDKNGRLRFHVLGDKGKPKKRIQTTEEKIFVLTNDFLTGDPLVHDLSMTQVHLTMKMALRSTLRICFCTNFSYCLIMQDMNSVSSNGCRIAKCMKEYLVHKKSYIGALNSTLLAKSLHQKLWDNSKYLLKQLPGIGMVTAKVSSAPFVIVIIIKSPLVIFSRFYLHAFFPENCCHRHCNPWILIHLRN